MTASSKRNAGRAVRLSVVHNVNPSPARPPPRLPPAYLAVLRQAAASIRARFRGLARPASQRKPARLTGVLVLFTGSDGTGHALAAQFLAATLKLDLYRVDLPAVASKYIGETEKNLRRLFDAAETAGAILFFDEADALFGKRTEIKDAHDRHANIEVSYLREWIERFDGIVILSTNVRGKLDGSFLHKFHVVVQPPPAKSARHGGTKRPG